MEVELVRLLMSTYLLQDLTSVELQPLVNSHRLRRYAKGDPVFRRGIPHGSSSSSPKVRSPTRSARQVARSSFRSL
jgi:hypothetical protein